MQCDLKVKGTSAADVQSQSQRNYSSAARVSASEGSLTGGDSPLPSNEFFVDYSSSSCLKDCEPGPFGCMLVPPPVALYDSIAACCSVSMWWVDYSYCTSRSVGNYTNGWTVDFQNEKCSEF